MLIVTTSIVRSVIVNAITNTRFPISEKFILLSNDSGQVIRIDKYKIKALGVNSDIILALFKTTKDGSITLYREFPIAAKSTPNNVIPTTYIEFEVEDYIRTEEMISVGILSNGTVNTTTGQNVFNVIVEGFKIEDK